ncbi:MAG: hypothetical protein OI74_02090 [Gammaproteobacteria bacterium (ex Lamellibrachia satsuma)]|nr:MAG: diguanylate cyclase [Gammaproteobacteria bacterium (ex Lamellibrachia satsuma)]RRS34012.1 MAG: hypothetical protein NV67_14845 [Gammaproteobacteria bacterium (ex Lamellibrachia satsuma)]RRS35552.1 MAG: hypothetical protein OI74_02090 [Gammaproteobacteria bacterium (ex Lamellibrachia satsuma)]
MMKLTHQYLLGLGLLVAVFGLVIFGIWHQLYSSQQQALLTQSGLLLNRQITQFELAFEEIHSDLRYLANISHIRNLLREENQAHEIRSASRELLGFSTKKKRYDQIRFIDNQGMERIRINYNNGVPETAPQESLQSKVHRYYFTEAIGIAPDHIYTSRFDLNMEHGEVEVPLKPMIRFATPVTDSTGKRIGVLVLNYLGRQLLSDLQENVSGFEGHALLLNKQGGYIISHIRELAWNFMFPNQPQVDFQAAFPDAWSHIQAEGNGQYISPKGLFSFARHSSHRQLPPSDTPGDRSDHLFILVHYIAENQLRRRTTRELQELLPALALFALVLAIAIGFLLWNRSKQKQSEQQILHLHQAISDERDLFMGGPTTIIRWRYAFGWPVDYISTNVESLLGYPAARFFSGELTLSSIIAPDFLQQVADETEQTRSLSSSWFERTPYQVVTASGERLWIQDTTTVIRDQQGRITHFFAYINDITPLKNAEEQLTRSRDYIQKVLDTIADPTLVIDINDYSLQLSNQSARNTYCGGNKIPAGSTCFRLSHKRDTPCRGKHDPCPIEAIRKTGEAASVIHKHFSNDGEVIYAEVSATPVFDETGQVAQIIESHRDITHHVEIQNQLKQLAATDRLTNIYNRMKFDDELESQIRWARETGNPLSLIMFDIDHFKSVNDTFGHDVGDEVLKQMVSIVQQRIRKSDILARWGGEEFMIITPLADAEVSRNIAEHLRAWISDHSFTTAGRITASFGASSLKAKDTAETLTKRVDAALYASKQNGRNQTTLIN